VAKEISGFELISIGQPPLLQVINRGHCKRPLWGSLFRVCAPPAINKLQANGLVQFLGGAVPQIPLNCVRRNRL
jgi:hypothetical protein